MANIEDAENTLTDYCRGYSADVDTIREEEYPQMKGMISPTRMNLYTLTRTPVCRDNISRSRRDHFICQLPH